MITKKGGKFYFKSTELAAKSADEALIEVGKLLEAAEAEQKAAASKPLAFSTTWKGKFSIRPNNGDMGRYPYVELHTAQMQELLDNFDAVVAAFEAAKQGKLNGNQRYQLVARWQDAPKGENPDKAKGATA